MNKDKDFSKIVSDEIDTEPGDETQLSGDRLDSFSVIDEDKDISPYNSMSSSVEVPVNDMIHEVTNDDDETNDETITAGKQDEVQAGVQEIPLAEDPSEEGYEKISNEEVAREEDDVNDEGVTNIDDVNEVEEDVNDEDVQSPKSNEDDVTEEDVKRPKSNEDDVTDEDVKSPKSSKKIYFLVAIIVVFALVGVTLYSNKTKTISRRDDGSMASGGETNQIVDDELFQKQQEEEQRRQAEEEEKRLQEETKKRWYKIGGGITVLAVVGAGFYLKMGNASKSVQGNRQKRNRPDRDEVAKRQLHKIKNKK